MGTQVEVVLAPEIMSDPYFKVSKERASSYLSDLNYAVPHVDDKGRIYVRHYWQTCKDYLQETIVNYIYGTHNHRSQASYLAGTRWPRDFSYVALRSTNIDKVVAGVEKYLVPAEQKAGLTPTAVLDTDHKYVKVFQADPLYFQDPPLANMLMMFLRCFWWSDKIEADDLDGFLNALADQQDQYRKATAKYTSYEQQKELMSKFVIAKDASMLSDVFAIAPNDVYSKILSNMEELVITHKELTKAMEEVDNKELSIHSAFGQGSFIQGIYSKVGEAGTTMLLLPPKRQKAWVAALGTRRGVQYSHHYECTGTPKVEDKTRKTITFGGVEINIPNRDNVPTEQEPHNLRFARQRLEWWTVQRDRGHVPQQAADNMIAHYQRQIATIRHNIQLDRLRRREERRVLG